MSACQSTPDKSVDYSGNNAQDLLTVDCLLPPQVRQLGTRLTYIAQRRAIRTSGANCALRGGEYIAYDRADFKSALAVWLPLAEDGDPEAQTYVGEIYEKGLGTRASFELAASWYQRAVYQNYSRAQINLGYLYESGLGVKRDLTKALNLYRQASGFTAAELEFVSSIEITNRRVIRQQNARLQMETQVLQSEILAGRDQLRTRKAQLRLSENEVLKLRESIVNSNLNKTESTGTALEQIRLKEHAKELVEYESQLDRAVVQKQTLQAQLDSRNDTNTALRKQLTMYEDSLDLSRQKLQSHRRIIEKLDKHLDTHDKLSAAAADSLQKAKNESLLLTENIALIEHENKQKMQELSFDASAAKNEVAALINKIAQQSENINQIEQKRQAAVTRYEQLLTEKEASFKALKNEKNDQKKRYSAQQADDAKRMTEIQDTLHNRENELEEMTTQIEALQSSLTVKQANMQPVSVEQTAIAQPTGPSINIIDPPVLITQGSPTLTQGHQIPMDMIGKVEPVESLFAFRINGFDHSVTPAGMFRFNTQAHSGKVLEFFAVDDKGASTRLQLSIPQPTAISLKNTIAPSNTQEALANHRLALKSVELGKYHALIIGNNNYQSLKKLTTASDDAIAIENILRKKYGFNTVLLLDADQKTLLGAMERLRATLGEQDNLVIYYAGHGEQDSLSGRGYWLPVDADTNNKDRWIANSAITDMIDTMKAKHVLVIADSCYSGSLTRSSIARPLSGVSAELRLKWLGAVSQSRVRTVLSSGSNHPLRDNSGNARHSIFATELINALDHNTEVLETYELFFELQQRVAAAAAQLNVKQIPQYAPIQYAGHQAGEFIFVPVAQTTIGSSSGKRTLGDP